jgi:hypothetical protein
MHSSDPVRAERAPVVVQQIHDQHRMIRRGERGAVGDEKHRRESASKVPISPAAVNVSVNGRSAVQN